MSPHFRLVPLAAAIAALPAAHAQGTPPAEPLPSVVVTATRTPQSAVDLVTDTSVVDADRLRAAGQSGLADLLSREQGVQIVANGGPGSTTQVLLRGASNGQTLTLIEGFRIGSETSGTTSFQGLAPARFGRVEVLRGPASGLYGADAIGGVVQLFLPRGEGPLSVSGDAAYGTWNTRLLNAGLQGGNGSVDYAVSVGQASSDGYNATKPGNTSYNADRDGYERANAAATINLTPRAGHTVGLVAYTDHLDAQYDDGPRFADARSKLDSRLLGLRSSHALTDTLRLELRTGETRDRREAIARFPGVFDTRQRQYAIDLGWRANAATELVAGYERLDQDVAATSYTTAGTPSGRTTDSLRAGAFVNLRPHVLQATVRRDDNSQYGTETTGSIAYGYRLTDALRLGGGWSSGFKAPSFNDLYFPNFGRSSIRPESSRNTEAGVYWDTPTSRARIVAYRNEITDLIVFAPTCPDAAYTAGCADNVNDARITGVSIGGAHRIGATRVQGSIDFQRPMDETLDRRLVRRAERFGAIAVDHAIGRGAFGVEWQAAGERYDDAANTRRLGGYGIVNLRAEWALSRDVSVFARVNNLFDKDYETARLFAMPGFNALVGLRYAPK